jgi:hypothetical protein
LEEVERNINCRFNSGTVETSRQIKATEDAAATAAEHKHMTWANMVNQHEKASR